MSTGADEVGEKQLQFILTHESFGKLNNEIIPERARHPSKGHDEWKKVFTLYFIRKLKKHAFEIENSRRHLLTAHMDLLKKNRLKIESSRSPLLTALRKNQTKIVSLKNPLLTALSSNRLKIVSLKSPLLTALRNKQVKLDITLEHDNGRQEVIVILFKADEQYLGDCEIYFKAVLINIGIETSLYSIQHDSIKDNPSLTPSLSDNEELTTKKEIVNKHIQIVLSCEVLTKTALKHLCLDEGFTLAQIKSRPKKQKIFEVTFVNFIKMAIGIITDKTDKNIRKAIFNKDDNAGEKIEISVKVDYTKNTEGQITILITTNDQCEKYLNDCHIYFEQVLEEKGFKNENIADSWSSAIDIYTPRQSFQEQVQTIGEHRNAIVSGIHTMGLLTSYTLLQLDELEEKQDDLAQRDSRLRMNRRRLGAKHGKLKRQAATLEKSQKDLAQKTVDLTQKKLDLTIKERQVRKKNHQDLQELYLYLLEMVNNLEVL